MADYDSCDQRLTTSSSLETAVSSLQALPNSTSESMWEGWTLASPTVSQCALTEQLQQHLGGGFSSTASAKSGSSYQHDLLSSWLMSGYQTVGGQHQQQQQQQAHHGGEECSGITTTMYQDEFSRMNICSSTSAEFHGSVASASAAAGVGSSTDASQQNLYDVMQTCSSSVQTGSSSGGPTVEDVGQSAQFLNTPALENDHHHIEGAAHKLDDHGKQKMNNHATVTELRSRASSSSPSPALNNSYGQTMQAQHLSGGQFDNYWASTGSTAATVASSSPQPSVCSVGGINRSSGHHREDHQPNIACDSIILHHQHQQNHQNQHHRSKKRSCEGDAALFHNSGTDLTTDQMYTELHGLFGKSLDAHAAADLHHQQVASNAAGSYGDHSNWTQFTVSPNLSGPSVHAGGFMGLQEVADRTMFECSTADSLSTAVTHAAAAARREELSPSSAGTAMSTIHNFTAAAAADLAGHATLPYNRSSSSTDLESSDMGSQRKRPFSRGTELQLGGNGVNVEDSVKRSCITHHRNLWQLQSQMLFGRLPGNFLMGGSSSSNSGPSMDMSTAIQGPALNTNGRPRARRGSATDPQSVYARHRRERINDRLKVLQHLVPNGAKVDIVTMLEEAINYVKFLQLQVRLLSSDELWIYAPTTYNGMDVSMGMHAGLLDQQA